METDQNEKQTQKTPYEKTAADHPAICPGILRRTSHRPGGGVQQGAPDRKLCQYPGGGGCIGRWELGLKLSG